MHTIVTLELYSITIYISNIVQSNYKEFQYLGILLLWELSRQCNLWSSFYANVHCLFHDVSLYTVWMCSWVAM